MFVYVVRHGAVLGINGGQMTIKHTDSTIESLPKCLVEGVSVFANVVLTTAFVNYCLSSNTNVGFFSKDGFYKGSLCGLSGSDSKRIRRQIMVSSDEKFQMIFAKKIIRAKVNNQIVVSRRYSKKSKEIRFLIDKMNYIAKRKIRSSESINQLIGFEGIASRYFFKSLSLMIEQDFSFEKRTRRPARDPFNCMLNMGYSVLAKEIYGELVNRNLNPYIGIIHQDKPGHPALVSDLIEEWRPIIVDSAVMSLIQGHEISIDEFDFVGDKCVMSDKATRILLSKLERKMGTKSNYLSYIDKRITFREAIWHQAYKLCQAIDSGNPSLYFPVITR